MLKNIYNPAASAPMHSIVRLAVVLITVALFIGSSFNAMLGHKDIAIVMALATPLGISAWGFARAGYTEPAMGLLCAVLIVVVTFSLALSPLGVHDVALSGYLGVALIGALLLSRRAFGLLIGVTLVASAVVFACEMRGITRSAVVHLTAWPQYAEFVVLLAVFAALGRVSVETLFGSLTNVHRASTHDPVTGLLNRAGFLARAEATLAAAGEAVPGILAVVEVLDLKRTHVVVGRAAGDRVICQAAEHLQQAAANYLVARISDDEFAVLAMEVSQNDAPYAARRIHEAMRFDFAGVSVRSATGYARFPRDAHTAEALLAAAHSALGDARTATVPTLAGPADRI